MNTYLFIALLVLGPAGSQMHRDGQILRKSSATGVVYLRSRVFMAALLFPNQPTDKK
jgi:hypothetical protein